MKKSRPQNGRKKAGRAPRSSRSVALKAGTTQRPDDDRSNDIWRWHQAAGAKGASRPPARGAKGPPPKAVKPATVAKPAGASVETPTAHGGHAARRTSKLHPALQARLLAPLPTPPAATAPVWAQARERFAQHQRADRLAALIILLPVLIAATLMATLQRFEGPNAQRLARSHTAPGPGARRALAESVPRPPFVRPPERAQSTVAMVTHDLATHDLAAIIPKLARDAAEPARAFRRPTEALIASIPLATHDLAAAAVALQADVARVVVAFVRPPEALAAVVPDADRDARVAALPELAAPALCRAPVALLAATTPRKGQSRLPVVWPAPQTDPSVLQDPERFGLALSDAAKAQSNDLVVYNARYMQIAYPRGDVPAQFGVCTDVVIRAYRALDIDLQELVHLTRASGPSDSNIDHRRTELLRRFLATYGTQHPTSPYTEDYLPGDIVTYYRPQNKSSTAHIAIVTDVVAPSGRPMIAHNRGWGVQLEDALFVDQMTGHYRFRGLSPAELQRSAVASLAAKRGLLRVATVAPAQAHRANVETGARQPSLLDPPMGLGLSPK